MAVLMGMYVMSGLLLIGLSIPLIRRKIGPNPFYGFRVAATLADPEVWYDVNAHSGRGLLWVGVVTVAAALGFARVPGISVDAYAILSSVLMVGALIWSVSASFRYLRERQG